MQLRLSEKLGMAHDPTKFKCRISNFDKLGLLTILFDTPLIDQNLGVNIKGINEDVLHVKLLLSDESKEMLSNLRKED